MPKVKCPRCAAIVDYAPPAKPVCASCGFGAPAQAPGAKAPSSGPAASGAGTGAAGTAGAAGATSSSAGSRPAGAPASPTAFTRAPAPQGTAAPAAGVAFGRAATPAAPAAPAGTATAFARAPAPAGTQGGGTAMGTAVRSGAPGKARGYGRTLLLLLVTFGIYGLYYNYRAFREVDEASGQTHQARLFWLWLGLSLGGFVVYFVVMGAAGAALGAGSATAGAGLLIVGLLLYLGAAVASLVVSILYFVRELAQLRQARMQSGLAAEPGTAEVMLWYFVGSLIFVGPFIALYKVNRAINGYWQRTGIAS